MKALHGLSLLCIIAGSFLIAPDAQARRIWGRYDDLTPDQQRVIQNGGQVTLTENVPNAPWPKITIYQRIESTPEEGLAVFADYELQPRYVPNMKRAKIVGRVDPVTTRVDYVMDVAGDVLYTSDNRVSSYDNGYAYRMDSQLVKGDSMKQMYGSAQFEQLGSGTLVIYHTFILPTSSMAGWFKKKAIEMAQKAANSLVVQVQAERKSNPELLHRQVEALRGSLRQGSRWRSCRDRHWNGGLNCSSRRSVDAQPSA